MSSQSPRGSVSGVATSDEVAADFEESLKDLQTNNKYEISNLTIIAKENTEHAQAISRALENHIKTTSPTRKLPALFVLDSIVKNVGTPYTVYLGRNLYSTFMDAYTLVDSATRRHMDAMLRTWKEPVPGSIDPRPVFPREIVQPLDNAMIKYRTAVVNAQKSGQPQGPHRGTGTPPQFNGQFATPPNGANQSPYPHHPHQQSTPQQSPFGFSPPPQNLANDVEGVKRDIDGIVLRFQHQLAVNPHDASLQRQVGALHALRNLLSTQRVSPTELQQIKSQVSALAPAPAPAAANHQQSYPQLPSQPYAPTPQWQPTAGTFSQPYQPPSSTYPATLPPQPPATAPPNLSPDALQGLQALLSSAQKPSTPQLRAAMPGLQYAPHAQLSAIQNHAASAPATQDTETLLASLARAGLIKPSPAAAASAPPPVVAPPQMDSTAALLQSLQNVLPAPSQSSAPRQPPAQNAAVPPSVPITAASLKTFRPELVYLLYDAQPNQCSTCGRRFQATQEGREKKSRHLDWHFRTNQRMADPNTNRGHHRNWFVDEMEWVRHIEFDPSTTTATAADQEAATKPQKNPSDQTVRAPAGMTKSTCSVCYEDLKSTYSEDLQDWVFTNAAKLNGRIVHATCLAEMTQSQAANMSVSNATSLAAALASVHAGQRERSATPDSLLGKRKAESTMTGNGPRLKMQ